MSTHLSYHEDAQTVYCPDTEQNEDRRYVGGDEGPQAHLCGGCWDVLDENPTYAHHTWTEETWNCGGMAEIAEDGETCLGCGYNTEHTLESVNALLMDIELAERDNYFAYGRHR